MKEYILHAFDDFVKPALAFIIASINYILFPDKALMIAAMAVGIGVLLDIQTKFRAIAKKNGGYWKAFKTRKLNSNSLWEGTKNKLYAYFVIFIFAGLSYRICSYAIFQDFSILLASVAYFVIFLRELQSCLENIDDAGGDVKWLLKWTKKKQKQILEVDEKENENNE